MEGRPVSHILFHAFRSAFRSAIYACIITYSISHNIIKRVNSRGRSVLSNNPYDYAFAHSQPYIVGLGNP